MPELSVPPVSTSQIRAYAEASLDFNPIHTDRQLALSAGLDGVPVQGMLIMGQFEALISKWRPDAIIRHLDARFVRPLTVDRRFRVLGRVVQAGEAEAKVRLTAVEDDSGLVCIGGAKLSFSRD